MPRNWIPATLLLIAAALVPSAADAQSASRQPVLSGRVIDRATGAPVTDAIVYVGDDAITVSDEGRFQRRLRPGSYEVEVSRLGYAELKTVVTIDADDVTEDFALVSEPLLLERVQVYGNRMRSRRNAIPTSVRAFERRELVASAAPNLLEFVRTRAGVIPAPCRGRSLSTCAWVRGQSLPVIVTINEMPMIGGLSALAMYRGDELHTVEVLGGGNQVRIFTLDYVERSARRGWRPM